MSENELPVSEAKDRIILELPFDETLSFLKKELKRKKRTPYWLSFVFGLLFMFILRGIYLLTHLFPIGEYFLAILLSFVFLIPLIFLHEFIHGFAFRIKGAKKIQYGIIWKSFAAYAVAVDFEYNYKQFRFIALAPLVLISVLLTGLMFSPFLSTFWKQVCYFTFLQHYLACIGDILSLSYFYRLKDRNIVTYDDVDKRISYFVEKE